MANYRAHVSTATLSGAAALGIAWSQGLPFSLEFLGLGLSAAWLGGIFPDVDHDTGTALVEITALISSLLPILLLSQSGDSLLVALIPAHIILHALLRQMGLNENTGARATARGFLVSVIMSGIFIYLRHLDQLLKLWPMLVAGSLLIHMLRPAFERLTVHRGLFHSLPALLVATGLLALWTEGYMRLVLALAFFVGGLSHLILDEIFSVDWEGRRLKRSFGTALCVWKRKSPLISGLLWLLSLALAAQLYFNFDLGAWCG